jgi:hypothetical protein
MRRPFAIFLMLPILKLEEGIMHMKIPVKVLAVIIVLSPFLQGCAVYAPPAYAQGPYYDTPVITSPYPVYAQPAPVYVEPAPVYVGPPVFLRFNFGYWSGGRHGWGGGHHGWRGGGHYRR